MDGIIDKGIYWHIVLGTLFQGGAIVMALAILVRLVISKDWHLRGVNMRLANGTMVALLAVWCLIFAVLTMIAGLWMTWGYDAVRSLSLTINKTMFGTFILLGLVLMIGIRFKYGPDLWESPSLKLSYSALGVLVALFGIVNGSLGGEASLLGTILAPVWDLLGIPVRYPMILPAAGGIVLVIAAVAVTGLAIIYGSRKKGAARPKVAAQGQTPAAS